MLSAPVLRMLPPDRAVMIQGRAEPVIVRIEQVRRRADYKRQQARSVPAVVPVSATRQVPVIMPGLGGLPPAVAWHAPPDELTARYNRKTAGYSAEEIEGATACAGPKRSPASRTSWPLGRATPGRSASAAPARARRPWAGPLRQGTARTPRIKAARPAATRHCQQPAAPRGTRQTRTGQRHPGPRTTRCGSRHLPARQRTRSRTRWPRTRAMIAPLSQSESGPHPQLSAVSDTAWPPGLGQGWDEAQGALWIGHDARRKAG